MDNVSIRIVLVGTTHPGNIGSTARAMKTMGLSSLFLVDTEVFPHIHAYELAAGADDVLHQAVICQSLSEALSDCHVVFGTSARIRGVSLDLYSPKEAASVVSKAKKECQYAFVFGREKSGLTNEELQLCHYQVVIDANPQYSSLNLAMAVQIICYEVRMACLETTISSTFDESQIFATHGDMLGLFDSLYQTLVAISFVNPLHPKRVFERVMRILSKVTLTAEEVSLLRGMLSKLNRQLAIASERGVIAKDSPK
jgi:tRNA (cytidine32/uridine32-2'-O)-methyltransferase